MTQDFNNKNQIHTLFIKLKKSKESIISTCKNILTPSDKGKKYEQKNNNRIPKQDCK